MKICPDCRATYHEDAPVCPADGTSLLDLEPDDARCGTVVDGRFLVLSQLGQGGMGTVYRAWQFSTRRLVALKLLIADISANPTAIERFMREARVTAGLNSPHVVRVYDFGQLDDGTAYMAMELLDGTPLDALIDEPMAPARAIELVRQICIALEEAHGQGLVHRDLKPGNIIVRRLADGGDFAQVLDFGIAKVLDETRTALTAENQNPGTPAYMSPEQARNETVGPPTDLYALSVIFFELLVGERPFTGTSAMSVLLQHVQATPPRLAERLPDLPRVEAVDAVLQRGLAKDPAVRYPSAAVLRGELDKLRTGVDPVALTDPLPPVVEAGKRRFGLNLQALGCSVQLAVAVGALALFILPAMRDGSDRFDEATQTAPALTAADPAADSDRFADLDTASPVPPAGGGRTTGQDLKREIEPQKQRALPLPNDAPPPPNDAPPSRLTPKRAAANAPGSAPLEGEEKAEEGMRADDGTQTKGESERARRKARRRLAGPAAPYGGGASAIKPPPGAGGMGAETKTLKASEVGARASGGVGGTATPGDLRRALLALQPRLRAQCGPGRWPLQLLVAPDGQVQRVAITQPGRAADARAKCALGIVRDARLPRPSQPTHLTLTL